LDWAKDVIPNSTFPIFIIDIFIIEMDIKYISELYNNLSYYDLYSSSIFIFIIITLFVFIFYSYFIVLQKKQEISDDWVNQRCKPQNIPFAGYINKPEGVSTFEYTNQNFQYCVNNILVNIVSYVLQPFNYFINNLTNIFNVLGNSINVIRNFSDLLRKRIASFTSEILGRILNVIIPFQQMFAALIDMFNKAQGIMITGLYTMLGSYYALQSLMGAIMELIIKMLSVLVVIIVGLWVMPFTWPAAASMSAVFLAIAIPLSIIVVFMSEVLHIKSSSIPKLRCFDKSVELTMNNGKLKQIQYIQPGDYLENNVLVTDIIKVTAKGLNMYNLNNIIVSESHILKYNNKWIPVCNHPDAILISNYKENYLYCINTSIKEIHINGIIFTDWDEIYEDGEQDTSGINIRNIQKYLDYGLEENTLIELSNGNYKEIQYIEIGSELKEKGIVYGIVKINPEIIQKQQNLGKKSKYLYHLLVSNGFITLQNKIIPDYNYNVDFINK
jgi:hypothetical protein